MPWVCVDPYMWEKNTVPSRLEVPPTLDTSVTVTDVSQQLQALNCDCGVRASILVEVSTVLSGSP